MKQSATNVDLNQLNLSALHEMRSTQTKDACGAVLRERITYIDIRYME